MRAATFIALLSLFAAGSSARLQAADDPKVKELAKLEGSWKVVAVEQDDMPLPRLVGGIYTFQGDKMTILKRAGANKLEATFKIDPTKSPKQIDWDYTNSPFPGSSAIYRFDGDTLILCYPTPGIAERPKEFGGDAFCFRLERMK
jgi:uncharacterized protein (TIGR03067 family)